MEPPGHDLSAERAHGLGSGEDCVGGPMNIISLGAGVQSSTMVLMAAHGEITPMPDCAIFADTQAEPSEVYDWLSHLETRLPFKVYRVTQSNLAEHIFDHGFSQIPVFIRNASGSVGMGKRQCTKHWKIEPVQRELRRFSGMTRRHLTDDFYTLWQGISTDEASRMKDSRAHWIKHRFPLIEMNMSRDDCLAWLRDNGIDLVVKSACVFCPYQRRDQWKEKKIKGGAEWEMILDLERRLLERGEYLTPDCTPVADFADATKPDDGQLNMFENECEGLCGV